METELQNHFENQLVGTPIAGLLPALYFPAALLLLSLKGWKLKPSRKKCCKFGDFCKEKHLHYSPEIKTRVALMSLFILLSWGSCGEGVDLWAKKIMLQIQVLLVLVFPLSSVGLS